MDYFSTVTLGVIILMVMTAVVLIWQTLTVSRHEGPCGTFVEVETQRVTSAVRVFLWQLFKGPVFALVLFALTCFYFQAQYEQAVSDFEDELSKKSALYTDRANELKSRLGRESLYPRTQGNISRSLLKTLNRSHRQGYFATETHAFFQLIEGYEPDGDIIWSDEIHVYGKTDESRFIRYKFHFSDLSDFSSAAPLPKERVKTIFDEYKHDYRKIDPGALGRGVLTFDPEGFIRGPEPDAHDIVFEMGMHEEGAESVLVYYATGDFPPSPR